MISPAVLPTRPRRRAASLAPVLGTRPAADHQPRPDPKVVSAHEPLGLIRPWLDMLGRCVCGWPLFQDEIYGWIHLAGPGDLEAVEEAASALRGEQAATETSDPKDIVGTSTTHHPSRATPNRIDKS